jgi:hypothetical protein
MIAIIFISILLLVVTTLLLGYRSRRLTKGNRSKELAPRDYDGLFAEERAIAARELAEAEANLRIEQARAQLIGRAAMGDRTALDDAHGGGDKELYREALRALIARIEGEPQQMASLARYIIDSRRLRSTADFARMMIDIWSQTPDQKYLVEMIYFSALSDDAQVFQHAVELALRQWHEGELRDVSAKDFLSVVESAYWLITAEVRNSGSGFLIKKVIVDLRRELAAPSRRSNSST